jgi:hypothetical protein
VRGGSRIGRGLCVGSRLCHDPVLLATDIWSEDGRIGQQRRVAAEVALE